MRKIMSGMFVTGVVGGSAASTMASGKEQRRKMRKVIVGASVVSLMAIAAPSARAVTYGTVAKYNIIYLGPVSTSQPDALNSLGQAVGTTAGLTAEAFNNTTTASGTPSGLGTLGGTSSFGNGINARGVVVGSSTTGVGSTSQGYTYSLTTTGPMTSIGSLAGTNGNSSLAAINDNGIAVGGSQISSSSTTNNEAITYASGAFSLVGATGLIPGGPTALAAGLNGNTLPTVVGSGTNSAGANHAWVYIPGVDTNPRDIGALTSPTSLSTAFAVNNANEVVGYSNTSTPNGSAFVQDAYEWTPTGGMVDLGVLPGTTFSYPRGINNSGVIVGYSSTDAWLNDGTGFVDLNSLITADSNWTLQRAYGINDAGDIVGFGTLAGKTGKSGFLLVPAAVPEPASLSLLAVGGITLLGGRRSRV